MKRYYILFAGRVQGVGFRSFVQMNAMKFNCTGYSKNLDNGNVEVEIQGEEKNIDELIKTLRMGNQFIKVDEYFLKEIPLKDEDKFSIKYY